MAKGVDKAKAILVLLAVIVGVVVWQLQTSDTKVGTPTSDPSATASTASTETTASATPPEKSTPMAPANDTSDKASPPRKALTEASRRKLQVALEAGRKLRTARAPARGSASGEDAVPTVLTIANKTGSSSEWEQRQLETLNQLLGECYDLGASEEPGLSGTLGVRFALRGEPEIGGLVEGIEFMDDYSTIEQATMRECARESLYALELDPPPEGVTAAREITLRFDPE